MSVQTPEIISRHIDELELVQRNKYLIEIASNTGTRVLKHEKQVILITGPTGAGKDTLINELPGEYFVRWRTWTTREEVRDDELNEDPYVRAKLEDFLKEESLGNFIETNPYVGHRYGTHRREAEAAFSDGRIPVLRVDPRGADFFNNLHATGGYPFDKANLHHIYVIPPTLEELEARISGREKDPGVAAKRKKQALDDLSFLVNAHYLLISYKDETRQAASALISHLQSLAQAF